MLRQYVIVLALYVVPGAIFYPLMRRLGSSRRQALRELGLAAGIATFWTGVQILLHLWLLVTLMLISTSMLILHWRRTRDDICKSTNSCAS